MRLTRPRNPFNDDLIASASDDGKVSKWPTSGDVLLNRLGFSLESPRRLHFTQRSQTRRNPGCQPSRQAPGSFQVRRFVASSDGVTDDFRKVGHALFNPAAENILASASGDYSVKIWDVEAGLAKLTLPVGDIIQSLSWSANGSMLVTTSRDKKLRIWDTRQQKAAHEVNGHGGAKNSRAVWMGEHDRVATTGFSRMSDRQMALWDIKSPNQPISGFEMLDSISGVCMPFWDEGTQCLYLAGKGDGNIRYYEYENDKFEYLSEYKSADPQRGIAFLPKRGVNMHENEVTRAYKTVNDSYIEQISFIVPRRSETFQEDIYPPTVGLKPAMSSKEWLDGEEAVPPKISLESLYDGAGVKEVPSDQIKPVAKAPSTVKTEPKPQVKAPEPAAPEPIATPTSTARGPPPSMKEQGGSMAAMVGKYTDKEPVEEESDDDSSFEEIQKPAERTSATKPVSATSKTESIPSTSSTPKVEDKPIARQAEVSAPSPVAKDVETTAPTSSAETGAADSTASGNGLEREVRNLKQVLAQQTRQLATLTKALQDLTAEVKALKSS